MDQSLRERSTVRYSAEETESLIQQSCRMLWMRQSMSFDLKGFPQVAGLPMFTLVCNN
jgi:hypothetical protein